MSMEITTPAGTQERTDEMEAICFSDFHKDVYGYRPRWEEWEQYHAMDVVDFNATLDTMMSKMLADEEARKQEEEKAIELLRTDLRARLQWMHSARPELDLDWTDALAFLMDDEIGSNDVEYFCWSRGISWDKTDEIKSKYYAIVNPR